MMKLTDYEVGDQTHSYIVATDNEELSEREMNVRRFFPPVKKGHHLANLRI